MAPTVEATTRRAEPVRADSPVSLDQTFTPPVDQREGFLRTSRQALTIPNQINKGVEREAALFTEHCHGDSTDVTPLSPRVQKYIQDNPEMAKHFVLPVGEKDGVAFAGKTEYARASDLLEQLNRSAERMLDLHAADVPYNSKDFQRERSRSLSLARQLHSLTGDKPMEVGHSSFTNAQNREKWGEEYARLQGSLDKAAYNAQDKQLKLIERHEVKATTPWIEGVKLDPGAYNRFVGAVKGFSREGEEHPIVQERKELQRQKIEASRAELEQQKRADQAHARQRLEDMYDKTPQLLPEQTRHRISRERIMREIGNVPSREPAPLPANGRFSRETTSDTTRGPVAAPTSPQASEKIQTYMRNVDRRGAMADADVTNINTRVDAILNSKRSVDEKNVELDRVRTLIRPAGADSSGTSVATNLRSNCFVIQETPQPENGSTVRAFKLHAVVPRIDDMPTALSSNQAAQDAYMAGFNNRLATLALANIDPNVMNQIYSKLTKDYYFGGVAIDPKKYRIVKGQTDDYSGTPCIKIERLDGRPLVRAKAIKGAASELNNDPF